MAKKVDELEILLVDADAVCEALAAKRYVAVLGQQVWVYAGEQRLKALPVAFLAPLNPQPQTIYVDLTNRAELLAMVKQLPDGVNGQQTGLTLLH